MQHIHQIIIKKYVMFISFHQKLSVYVKKKLRRLFIKNLFLQTTHKLNVSSQLHGSTMDTIQ